MIYAVLVLLAAVMLCGSLMMCSRVGEKEGICKYGHNETDDTK